MRESWARVNAAASYAVPAAVVAVGAVVLAHYSLTQWAAHRVPSWDLGIFAQLAQDYAHGRAPIVPIKGPGYNLLGDHFHPILVLLGPLWRLCPSGLTLLLAQDLLIAASAWPLTRLAAQVLSWPTPNPASAHSPASARGWAGWARSLGAHLAAGALGLAYVLSWGVQGAVAAQFHEVAFAVPLLAWGGVAFVRGRYGMAAAWLAPLVFVKEDLGLTVFMAGLVIAWRAWRADRTGTPQYVTLYRPSFRRFRRVRPVEGAPGSVPAHSESAAAINAKADAPSRDVHEAGAAASATARASDPASHSPSMTTTAGTAAHSPARTPLLTLRSMDVGLALAAWGVAWFLLTVLLILPLLSDTGSWQYSLAGNVADGSTTTATHAGLLARLFTPTVKLETLGLLACSSGLVGLRSPWIALALPTLAWRFLSPKEAYWEWASWHYNLVLMPIVTIALLDVIATWRARAGEPSAPTATPHAPTSSDTAPSRLSPRRSHPSQPTTTVSGWAKASSGVGILLACATTLATAPHMPATGEDPYPALTGARLAAAEAAVAAIPAGASVTSDLGTLAYVVPGHEVYWLGTDGGTRTDYLIGDTAGGSWGVDAIDLAAWGQEHNGARYELVFSQDGYQVAKRVSGD